MAKLFYNSTRELVRVLKTGKAFSYLIFTPDLPVDQAFLIKNQSSEDMSICDLRDQFLPENVISFVADGDYLKVVDSENKSLAKSIVDAIKLIAHNKDKSYSITAFLRYLSQSVFDLWCAGSFMEQCLELANRGQIKNIPSTIDSEFGANAYFLLRNLPKEQKTLGLKKILEAMPITVPSTTVINPTDQSVPPTHPPVATTKKRNKVLADIS